jgi:hypothetical protein
MERLTVFILVVFIISSGCRMCGTDYDYCMPAIVDGGVQNAGALYRAGSILNGVPNNYEKYFCDPDCVDCKSDSSFKIEYNDNGESNSVDLDKVNVTPTQDDIKNNGWQGTDTGTNIGIPSTTLPNSGDNNNNQKIDPEFKTPSLEELMKLTPPRTTKPPKNNTPKSDTIPNNFTLDNLRQLDPSINDPDVQEIKILKIEDTTLMRR